MLFEWFEQKRLENLDKHGIDFLDAKEIWQGEVLEVPSAQQERGEQRPLVHLLELLREEGRLLDDHAPPFQTADGQLIQVEIVERPPYATLRARA